MMCAPDQIRAVQSVEKTAPISTQFVLNILLGNPVFIANQFQFCVIGIWWGRVGQRVFFADAGDSPRSQAVKAGLS